MSAPSQGKSGGSRQLLNVNEVAYLLHVHPNTVRLWSKAGTLKSYRIGKRRDYRYNLDDVHEFLYEDAGRQGKPA